MSQNYDFRRMTENYLVTLLATALLDAGYELGVDDGEEYYSCATSEEVISAGMAVDSFEMVARNETTDQKFWFQFVLGNDGYDVMADSTTNAENFLTECGYENATDKLEFLVHTRKCYSSLDGKPTLDGLRYDSMQALLDSFQPHDFASNNP